jgi:hypothetical protein
MEKRSTLRGTYEALRPPPSAKAMANRMSPAGITMFYASGDPQTAIAEIAGHGLGDYALVGAFRGVKRLRLLDLTRRPTLPSYFDDAEQAELGLAGFLDSDKTYVLFFDSEACVSAERDASGQLIGAPAFRAADWEPSFTLARDDISVCKGFPLLRRHSDGAPGPWVRVSQPR